MSCHSEQCRHRSKEHLSKSFPRNMISFSTLMNTYSQGQHYFGTTTNLLWFIQGNLFETEGSGPSPGFSSRGGHIFKIQYWMYAATVGPNVKWGVPISNGGAGHHWPPPLATTL